MWELEHRAFVMKRFYANGESVTQTQRDFRRHFNVPPRGPIPDRNTILRWMHNVNTTGSLMKRKPPGPAKTVRTSENVERVRVATLESPNHSLRKRASNLRISASTVRNILIKDLKFHPRKLAIHEDDSNAVINLFTRVSGIGPAKAKELLDAGMKTLEDLKKKKQKLNHHQQIGLKYFEDFEKKISREEVKQVEDIIKEELFKLDPEYHVTICGSYRRGKAESEDIDVLLSHPSFKSTTKKDKARLLKAAVKQLEDKKLITDTISLGDTKFMGVCNLNAANGEEKGPWRRLHILLIPHDQNHCLDKNL